MLERFQDWRIRLDEEIKKRERMKFSFGRHDCCFSAAACVKAETGTNILKGYVKYRGKKAAEELLKKKGGVEAIAKDFATRFEIPEVTVSRAQAGDVVLYNGEQGKTLGVVELSARSFVVPYIKGGWTSLPMVKALRVWRI